MNTTLFQVLAICLIALVPTVLLKQYKPEYAVMCALGAAAVLALTLFEGIKSTLVQFYNIFEHNESIAYCFKTSIKALGIAYITGFVADMCRDFGQTALASKAELGGKCAVFLLAVPMINALLEIALEVAGV